MNVDLYEAGLNFRRAVLEKAIPPEQFNSLLLDVCSEHDELKPALLDLITRRLFRYLPFTGTPSQQALARDGLLSELQPLYRDEIVSEIMEFVEGALGYVDLPCVDAEENEDAQQDAAYMEYPIEIPKEPLGGGFAQGQKEYYSDSDDGYSIRHQASPVPSIRRGSWSTSNSRVSGGFQINQSLSILGQVTRVIFYQSPAFSVFLTIRILAAVQADSVNFTSNLRLSELVYDYAYNSGWIWVSAASIAFWASLVHIQQPNVMPLSTSILALYVLIFLYPTLFLGWGFWHIGNFCGAVLLPAFIGIIVARRLVALMRLIYK